MTEPRQHRGRAEPVLGPVRTCVGCRTREPQRSLLRVALAAGQLTADPRRRLPGRGAYVHLSRACLARATERGGLARALHARPESPAVVGADELVTQGPLGPSGDSQRWRS